MDHKNPHSFEIEDLQKLILAATKVNDYLLMFYLIYFDCFPLIKDLDELDKKRKEDFKQYEMEKELQYKDSLTNMTAEEKHTAEQKHDEMVQKHKVRI